MLTKNHSFNPDCEHPPKPQKTALSQASREYINHETLQYKCFSTYSEKKPVFLGIFVIIDEIPAFLPFQQTNPRIGKIPYFIPQNGLNAVPKQRSDVN